MRNSGLYVFTEAQMTTQFLFGIKVNKQMVKFGKYFTFFIFHGKSFYAKIKN